jgi:hypothetical protein
MRVTRFALLFILSGFCLAPHAQSLIEITDLDSVAVVKPKMHGNSYQFIDNGAKEIQYRNIDNVISKDGSTRGLNGFSSAVLTQITGLGSSSKKEGFWKVSGAINCNDTLPEWQVCLFCEGYQQKDRERTRNDDGSVSMITNKTNVYYWDKNATGVILESIDTIGFFQIMIGIPEDELVKKWHEFIFNKPSSSQSFSSNSKWHSEPYFSYGTNYEISGKFRSKNFVLIQNGTNRKVWIFFDDMLACMFQGDIDYKGVSKKSRNLPYLMINKEIPAEDRRYLFRLAIISRFMNNYLDLYRY